MEMNYSDDARISVPVNFGGKNACVHRPQSRIPNRHSLSDLGFKRSGFPGRSSPYPRIPLSANRGKLWAPYKSEVCLQFQKGSCLYGENCCFAHNLSEMRKPKGEHVSGGNAMRRECRYSYSGRDCPYGDNCNFVHKRNEIVRRDDGGLSGRSGSDWIDCMSLRGGQYHNQLKFHKTKLCGRWEESGNCHYGKKCTYAHGREELQKLGHFPELGGLHASSSFAGSCERDEVNFMEWDIAKISEIYADWIHIGHNF